jgi:hypothetical protein
VQGIDVGVAAGFDKLSNRVTTKASVHKDGTTVHLDYDNVDRRPEVCDGALKSFRVPV